MSPNQSRTMLHHKTRDLSTANMYGGGGGSSSSIQTQRYDIRRARQKGSWERLSIYIFPGCCSVVNRIKLCPVGEPPRCCLFWPPRRRLFWLRVLGRRRNPGERRRPNSYYRATLSPSRYPPC